MHNAVFLFQTSNSLTTSREALQTTQSKLDIAEESLTSEKTKSESLEATLRDSDAEAKRRGEEMTRLQGQVQQVGHQGSDILIYN